MGFLWFVCASVYYGMTLHTSDLAGNRYINLFISGLIEIPAYTLAYFIVNRWGRRLPLVAFFVVAGIFLIASQVVPNETGAGVSLLALQTTCSMFGKFCITCSYGVVYIYAPELFPTTVRSQAMGVAAISGRIGSMLAPFSTSLNDIRPWLTSAVFGIISICGGLMALSLPETNGRPLPQTIDEIENWFLPKDRQIKKALSENCPDAIKDNKTELEHFLVNGNDVTIADRISNEDLMSRL
jgi:OCT family organic cation transporter-like MFS transporter 4/5